MKNQYFGDIGDYKKYSIIRCIALRGGLRVLVAWMLTPNDNRSDGRFIKYLKSPLIWRQYDSDIFDFLVDKVVVDNLREVKQIEHSGLLSNTAFYSQTLSDSSQARDKYFQELFAMSEFVDVVFLDPDNGVEVQSVKRGRKNSSKYVYWNEIATLFLKGRSVLLYQHFSRINREAFINQMALKILKTTDANVVFSFRAKHSVYFFVSQDRHEDSIRIVSEILKGKWKNVIEVREHYNNNAADADVVPDLV